MKISRNWKFEQTEIFSNLLKDSRLTQSAKKQINIFLDILRDEDVGFDTTSALMYGFLRNEDFLDSERCPLDTTKKENAIDYFRNEASIQRAKEALLLKKVSAFPLSRCFGDKIDLEDMAISFLTYASYEKHFTYDRSKVEFIYRYLSIPNDVYLNVYDLFHGLTDLGIGYADLMINLSRMKFRTILPQATRLPRLTFEYENVLKKMINQGRFDIKGLSANEFENLYCEILDLSGFKPVRIGGLNEGDGGVDIIAVSNADSVVGRFVVAAQCKTSSNKIEPSIVREFSGSISHIKINKGVIVTTSSFTDGARKFAMANHLPIDLMDYVELSNQLRKFIDKT